VSWVRGLTEWARTVDGEDGWLALCAVGDLREALEERLVELVEQARGEGASWRSIGGALGVTGQAVRKRYAALVEGVDVGVHSGGRTTGPQVR
jgi:hypothetical protein